MGAEITAMGAEVIANWKQITFAIGGFFVRLLWFWERPVKWLRIVAGILFLLAALYFNSKHTPHDYREVVAALVGLFTNNIISGLFRWWGVNEEGLMNKTKNWWQSDDSTPKTH
jgi:hypothetical protein